jgi:hypothetical protein
MRFSQLPAWCIASPRHFIAPKSFHRRRISCLAAPRMRSRGLSASTDATFRPDEPFRGGGLPSVRRNVPLVRRKTETAPGRPPGMGLKPFNPRRFSGGSISSISALSPISAP